MTPVGGVDRGVLRVIVVEEGGGVMEALVALSLIWRFGLGWVSWIVLCVRIALRINLNEW